MEILDPDLWNDDGTPKRPSKEYMDGLAVIQAGYEGLAKIADSTQEVHVTDKPVVQADSAYINYARIKRQARESRAPEVGDIVHFWDSEKIRCRASIVMETDPFSDAATLRVHIPHEAFQDWHADHSEDKTQDTWHWPCGEGQ